MATTELTPTEKKQILVTYLRMKLDIEDWHAVADVACDIRELESRYPELKSAHQPG